MFFLFLAFSLSLSLFEANGLRPCPSVLAVLLDRWLICSPCAPPTGAGREEGLASSSGVHTHPGLLAAGLFGLVLKGRSVGSRRGQWVVTGGAPGPPVLLLL